MQDYAPGDIVEIVTDKGLAYVQLTHTHPSYPPVVRFLKGPVARRPDNVTALIDNCAGKIAMVPLEGVLRKLNLAHAKVGEIAIPPQQKFPTFRMPIRGKQGEIIYWWFWDGQGLTYSPESDLSDAQRQMPLREVMSADRFLEQVLCDAG